MLPQIRSLPPFLPLSLDSSSSPPTFLQDSRHTLATFPQRFIHTHTHTHTRALTRTCSIVSQNKKSTQLRAPLSHPPKKERKRGKGERKTTRYAPKSQRRQAFFVVVSFVAAIHPPPTSSPLPLYTFVQPGPEDFLKIRLAATSPTPFACLLVFRDCPPCTRTHDMKPLTRPACPVLHTQKPNETLQYAIVVVISSSSVAPEAGIVCYFWTHRRYLSFSPPFFFYYSSKTQQQGAQQTTTTKTRKKASTVVPKISVQDSEEDRRRPSTMGLRPAVRRKTNRLPKFNLGKLCVACSRKKNSIRSATT